MIKRIQSAAFPESCDRVIPVIYDAESVVRKYIVEAISSGLVKIVFGYFLSLKNYLIYSSKLILFISAIYWSSFKRGGVETHPGQIALHVMPSRANSIATDFVNPTNPCFVDE